MMNRYAMSILYGQHGPWKLVFDLFELSTCIIQQLLTNMVRRNLLRCGKLQLYYNDEKFFNADLKYVYF